MPFPSPSQAVDHPDYSAACRGALNGPVQSLIREAVEAGWSEKEVVAALEELGQIRSLAMPASDEVHHLPAVGDFPVE